MRALAQVRKGEHRAVVGAFATLLLFMAGHAMLETARDALFLARVPASRLPWVYLLIAAVSVLIAFFASRRAPRTTGYTVSGWMLFSGLSALAFQFLVASSHTRVLYALYVWSGVIATVVVARFWVLLGAHFTFTQAKRLYGFIGAGSVLGAIVGSGFASVLTRLAHPAHLLTGAACLFVLSALGPLLLARELPARTEPSDEPDSLNPMPLVRNAYTRRIGLLILCSTFALTLADYLFKVNVSAHVPKRDLGPFFSNFYLGLNLLSLLIQLSVVQRFVRVVGVSGALTLLPGILIGGAFGLLLSGGFSMALSLKGADGALRYSVHRTVVELLFVPMNERLRSAAKTLLDVLGQRGGQALASLAILGALALGAGSGLFAASMLLICMLWIFIAYELREPYLDLFRQTLRESAAHPRMRFPSLDLMSLESVIAALNSTNDAEVRAALHILAEDGRTRLIPALILYHPSPAVVIDALEVLDRSERRDFVPITERLLEQGVPEVRAAVLRLRSAQTINEPLLRRLVAEDCAVVRATALVILVRSGAAKDGDFDALLEIVRGSSAPAKIALARAIAQRPADAFESILIQLATDSDSEVRKAALSGMAAAPTARYLQTLMRMLAQRELRGEARRTLVALGQTAQSFLAGALTDEARPLAQRRHIPRTLMRFANESAAAQLLEQLPVERDGVVRYKILRALTHMRRDNPELALDTQIVDQAILGTLARTYQLIEWRLVLKDGAEAVPQRKTQAQALLVRLLHDKEVHAIERLFLMLGLRFPNEDVAAVFRGIQGSNPNVRSHGRELLETLLDSTRRQAILSLTDDIPDRERLAQGSTFHRAGTRDYEAVLQTLLDSRSPALKSLAVYHAAEQGMKRLQPRIELLTAPQNGLLSSVARTAVEWLAELQRHELVVEG